MFKIIIEKYYKTFLIINVCISKSKLNTGFKGYARNNFPYLSFFICNKVDELKFLRNFNWNIMIYYKSLRHLHPLMTKLAVDYF